MQTVADINQVIAAKDAEFRDVLNNIESASARFSFIYLPLLN